MAGKEFQYKQGSSIMEIERKNRLARIQAFEEEEIQRKKLQDEFQQTNSLETKVDDDTLNLTLSGDGVDTFQQEENNEKEGFLSTLFNREEIDPKEQEKFKNEFQIYAEHKIELINEGIDLDFNDDRKPLSKEEKKNAFIAKRDLFQKRMNKPRRNFWGTKRYYRLLNKWFPDYAQVITHKVSTVKSTINESITTLNEDITKIIETLKEAIIVADSDIGKANQLIINANKYLYDATQHKDNAVSTLTGFEENKTQDFLAQYDTVLGMYQELILNLQINIQEIGLDKNKFETTVTQLSQQQTSLTDFNIKVNNTSTVLELVNLQNTEFVDLINSTTKIIEDTKKIERTTSSPDEADVQSKLDAGATTITNLDTDLEKLTGGVSTVYWGKGVYYGEEVDALYIVAKDYSAAANYTRTTNLNNFWFFVDKETGWTSVIQQKDAVTKYYLMNPVSSTEVTHLFIYAEKHNIRIEHNLSQLIELGLDSQEFRVLVEKVQDVLFGDQFKHKDDNGYGLYTPKTKRKLQESITDELEKLDEQQITEIFGPDYEQLPNVSKENQNVIAQLSSPEALEVYNLQKKYLEWKGHKSASTSEDDKIISKFYEEAKAKYESAAINKFGSVADFESLINNIEGIFQKRALQIANNVLNNTEKLIDFELKGYQDESKLQDLAVKLNPAKTKYETYLHERWEADNWANVSETMDSYSLKGMFNDWDYSAMDFANSAQSEAQTVAEQGHPMMTYYTQSANRNKFGSLLGLNVYHAPGTPMFDLELNDKGEFVSKSSDPYKNPYKHHGYGPNFDDNKQQAEPVNNAGLIFSELKRAGNEIKSGIQETRDNLKEEPSKVWDLDNVVMVTMSDLKLSEGTLAYKLIEQRIKQAERAKLFKDIFMAIAGIGLGILAISGIGTPLAVLCGLGSLGISAYQFQVHYDEYSFLKSASKTGFTPETSLSSVQPNEMWMMLDLLGIGLDIIAVVKIIGLTGKMTSLFKIGGEGADVLYKPQLLKNFEQAVYKTVKNTDEAKRVIAEFTKKLDDPNHVNAIRNTDFSKTNLKNADKVTDAKKVKPKESGTFVESVKSEINLKFWNEAKEVAGRKVYQRNDIFDPNYIHPKANGKTNIDLMKDGKAPFGIDGKRIELHHLNQKEPGTMVEVTNTIHKQHPHKLIEESFRNDSKLKYQYEKFRENYWKERVKDFEN